MRTSPQSPGYQRGSGAHARAAPRRSAACRRHCHSAAACFAASLRSRPAFSRPVVPARAQFIDQPARARPYPRRGARTCIRRGRAARHLSGENSVICASAVRRMSGAAHASRCRAAARPRRATHAIARACGSLLRALQRALAQQRPRRRERSGVRGWSCGERGGSAAGCYARAAARRCVHAIAWSHYCCCGGGSPGRRRERRRGRWQRAAKAAPSPREQLVHGKTNRECSRFNQRCLSQTAAGRYAYTKKGVKNESRIG
jgi:hypothetical protein